MVYSLHILFRQNKVEAFCNVFHMRHTARLGNCHDIARTQNPSHVIPQGTHRLQAFSILRSLARFKAVHAIPVLRVYHRHTIDSEILVQAVEGSARSSSATYGHRRGRLVAQERRSGIEQPVEQGTERTVRPGIINRGTDHDAVRILGFLPNRIIPNRSLDFGEIARLCHAACFSPSRRRSGLRRGVARNRMRTEAGKMPECLIFPIRNGHGVSNDRFGIIQVIVEHATSCLRTFVAGDAALHRFGPNRHDFRFRSIGFESLCHFLQSHIGIPVAPRASVNQQSFHCILF